MKLLSAVLAGAPVLSYFMTAQFPKLVLKASGNSGLPKTTWSGAGAQ